MTNLAAREYQAIDLYEKGEQKLSPDCCQKLFSSKSSRLTESYDCFNQAGQLYKLCKKFAEAGKCYEMCAVVKNLLDEDEGESYKEALHCFSQAEDPENYAKVFEVAIKFFTSKSRYNDAAQISQKKAEEEEKKENKENKANAIIYYGKAVEYFQLDKRKNTAKIGVCLLKKADLMCLLGDEKAPKECKKIYEDLGKENFESALTRSGAKELFGKSVLCALVYEDEASANEQLINCCKVDPDMESSMIGILCKNAIESISNKDITKLEKGIKKYKEMVQIDNWMSFMLTKVAKKLDGGIEESQIELDFK